MNEIKIIALCGPKTVGKTTIAKAIQERVRITTDDFSQIESFANPIRKIARAAGFEEEWLTNQDLKEKEHPSLGISPRDFMQSLSSVREKCPNFYVNIMKHEIENWPPLARDLWIIIDDCRFDNEAMWVNSTGGICVELFRDGVDYTLEHESECPVNRALIDSKYDAGNTDETAKEIFERALNHGKD